MDESLEILSYTCGMGERLHGLKYFKYNSQNEALAILTGFCLGMNFHKRVNFLRRNAAIYFRFVNNKTRSHTINDLPDRFSELIKPLLVFFGLYTTNEAAFVMDALNQKSWQDSINLIDAWKFKQKGIEAIKKFEDYIFHASCYWATDIELKRCCICGCNQPGFMLVRLFYCFDCLIEHAHLENVREVWENKLTDASGKIIKMYTRYITPNREIVFFDRDGNRMIHLNNNKIELPLFTKTLYQL